MANASHGITSHEILGPLCLDHHDLLTHRGNTIDPQPDGTRNLTPPDPHADDHGHRDTHAA